MGSDVDGVELASEPKATVGQRRAFGERANWPGFAEMYAGAPLRWSGIHRMLDEATVDCVAAFVWRTMGSPLIVEDAVALTSRAYSTSASSTMRSEEHTSELQSRQYLVC